MVGAQMDGGTDKKKTGHVVLVYCSSRETRWWRVVKGRRVWKSLRAYLPLHIDRHQACTGSKGEERNLRGFLLGQKSIDACRREDQSLQQIRQRDNALHNIRSVHQDQPMDLQEENVSFIPDLLICLQNNSNEYQKYTNLSFNYSIYDHF
ncbi:hypothetical protein XENOCAPTIV_025082 [Xenoophorus captivus]|uniref:Uncharacterized protein n=1 Tax=Xenoophorus captivus TaxID=1517983 RepID=A0ABV0QD48_9TELE